MMKMKEKETKAKQKRGHSVSKQLTIGWKKEGKKKKGALEIKVNKEKLCPSWFEPPFPLPFCDFFLFPPRGLTPTQLERLHKASSIPSSLIPSLFWSFSSLYSDCFQVVSFQDELINNSGSGVVVFSCFLRIFDDLWIGKANSGLPFWYFILFL